MFLCSLLLLVAAMTAAQEPEKQVDITDRNHHPMVHMWVLTGNWIDNVENELKNNMQTLQKVLNQVLSMEHQMLEALSTTDKQEKDMQEQSNRLRALYGRNSYLDPIMRIAEAQQDSQLVGLQDVRKQIQQLLDLQNSTLTSIQDSLQAVSSTSGLRHQKQRHLLETLRELIHLADHGPGAAVPGLQDCQDIHKFGLNDDSIYTILVPNVIEPKRVLCVMGTNGGDWTVIQHRENGTVNFHRNWQDYKQGFGDLSGEHWLGNEVVHQLSSSKNYSLRVELEDWDGNMFYANFEHFQLGSEEQFYRIFLDKYSGAASFGEHQILKSNNFSTIDADHDNCACNCAEALSGGWWFDNCGPSNLNGIYYPAGEHLHKVNGVRWHHSLEDPTYSLRSSRMMIRPLSS
ncbi:angiopoietin-4-like [Octodon degus]|uniref:Angiopoietin-4-like n=1 Tax=Octodon degus TaxID=10160 RepID=A0A6P3V9B6_OCTDE|nr:angiopoietin-4-like [Octodon degus]